MKTTWKVAGRPSVSIPQLIPAGDRIFLSFSSDNLTVKQDQLYWLDKNFKKQAVVLNSKVKPRAKGFISYNNQYFFEAYLGSKPSKLADDWSIVSIDANNKIKKWETPGYTGCRTGHVLGDFLYITCYDVKSRSETYNSSRAGSQSSVSIYDIDAIFAVGKDNTITKVNLPTQGSVDILWRGGHQLLLQSDSMNENQLSYFYLENGKVNYQFDLPNSVRIGQLTTAGWALTLPSDINAGFFGCPTHNVLSPEGQFARVTASASCTSGIPDTFTSLLFKGFPEVKKYFDQGEIECKKQLKVKTPRTVGFFNGHVLCYNDTDATDNLIHAFPSAYIRPALPNVVFPAINQKTVPKAPAYTPEATTPASTSGFPSLCPAIINTGNKIEPKVMGFYFDAVRANFVRIGEGTTSAVKAPASLVGCYADFETLSESPGGNGYAIGSINHDSTGYYWINGMGIRFGLTLSGSIMETSEENPYYSDGRQFILKR
jgi:hypothetical protein